MGAWGRRRGDESSEAPSGPRRIWVVRVLLVAREGQMWYSHGIAQLGMHWALADAGWVLDRLSAQTG